MGSLEEEFHTAFNKKYQRSSSLRRLLLMITATITSSWLAGACGMSIAWLLLLIGLVVVLWTSTVVQIIEEAKNDEMLRVRRRRALLKNETAEWLNFLFNRWWSCSSNSVFQILRERFEPLLNDAKPSFVEKVELRQFTFGDQTPCVRSIKAFELVDGRRVAVNSKSLLCPPLLCRNVQQQVAVEVDLDLNSDDFRMILRTRLFGKGVGMDLDIAMEKLNLCGKLDITLTVDVESAFPHITNVTVMFTEKPQIWFSVKMLKTVQMMEVPILKTWIHSVIMDALETSLVDPGRVHFSLLPVRQSAPGSEGGVSVAQGVLMVVLSASQIGCANGDTKWLVLRLGQQCWRTSPITGGWQETPSFLVESLRTDRLIIKLKSKKLVSTVTLAQYEMVLDEYNLHNSHVVETTLHKKPTRTSNIPSISVRLEYTPLPTVTLDQPRPAQQDHHLCCGVLTVFVHGAHGLLQGDPSSCNPYCMVFSNRRKVQTTQYTLNTTSPQWQARCQLLVTEYTQTTLSFVLCSWNPKKMADDEMLGIAVLTLLEGETWVVNRQLPLSGSTSTGTLTVSAVFQPVISMTRMSGADCATEADVSDLDSRSEGSNGKLKKNSISWVQQARSLLGRVDQDKSGSDISNLVASGLGLMEILIVRARDLVPMDMNGFSDPYCELKVNNECKYKSSVKKKTLNPTWEENAIVALPRQGDTLDVMLWDHDTFGMKDFLGSVAFSLEEIRQMSSLDCSSWYSLGGVRSGEVELKIKVISEDVSLDSPIGAVKRTSLPAPKTSAQASPIIRRPSMERSRLRLGVNVPPPTPPRTVSIPPSAASEVSSRSGGNSPSSSMQSVPHVTVTDSPSLTRASSRASSQLTTDYSVSEVLISPKEELPSPRKTTSELSGFRSMKLKVSRSLRLRRFKSEVNVRTEPSTCNGRSVERDMGGGDCLSHAVSQPNIPDKLRAAAVRPTDLNLCPNGRPDTYTGVEGRVVQAQGLHVAHVAQLYCRIRLILAETGGKHSGGKTIGKSHLLPAVPNPQFDLTFQINNPETVPRQAVLLFEIRSSGKETVALRRVSLQDLISVDGKDTHTWLALNNGATLEVSIAHGRPLKKPSRKLFRSWSVHRIGRI